MFPLMEAFTFPSFVSYLLPIPVVVILRIILM